MKKPKKPPEPKLVNAGEPTVSQPPAPLVFGIAPTSEPLDPEISIALPKTDTTNSTCFPPITKSPTYGF